ncbi:MAG: hypothetical protein AAFQ63_12970 [Cyanobacteria bacterium J06621_11]
MARISPVKSALTFVMTSALPSELWYDVFDAMATFSQASSAVSPRVINIDLPQDNDDLRQDNPLQSSQYQTSQQQTSQQWSDLLQATDLTQLITSSLDVLLAENPLQPESLSQC